MKKLVLITIAGLAATASAQRVGYYTDGFPDSTDPEQGILDNGFTPVQILDIRSFDFKSVDCLVINNSSNSGYTAELLVRVADIDAWTFAGGMVMTHDRFVSAAGFSNNPMLIGAPNAMALRDFSNDIDIDILTSTLIDNGPHGVLNDASLDGGNSSTHGYVDASTLPGGSTVALIRGRAPNEAVTMSYPYGAGAVIYSTIPLDFYLPDGGILPPMAFTYYPNAVWYLKTVASGDCAADLDGDGDTDADDFFAYLDAFASGNLKVCDIDGDRDCDADDFFGYLDLFAQGC